ncbi:uncharacterized protein LOC132624284 [Lycium barbarum]|uniref:uncharacterized protein LOC132624284 n=1 Tax=Lycium barbarum TaxID=112863 RepID=UPI00293E443F|nr:uncharacterized protein LOC132624284 [Lycium barbarum]
MLISLSAKNNLGIINGRSPKPEENSPYYPYWERCNNMVIAWITNSLSRNIAHSVLGYDTTEEIWADINDRFGQSNGSMFIQIQREIGSISQGNLYIASYFTKMRSLWDEMRTAYVGPVCSCGALPKFLEELKLFQFLAGLNESYSTVKSHIMMMSPLPSVSKAYSMLQHDEKQRENFPPIGFSTDSASFSASSSSTPASHGGYRPGGQKKSKFPSGSTGNQKSFPQRVQFPSSSPSSTLMCRYCKRSGHTIEKCHRLHGYPDDFEFNNNRRKTASCVQVDNPASPSSFQESSSGGMSIHGLTLEQHHDLIQHIQHTHVTPNTTNGEMSGAPHGYAHFAGLFCSSVLNSVDFKFCALSQISVDTWILDSGATNHMTPHKHLLQNILPLPKLVLIILPNRYKVKIVSTGSLHLRPDITLLNVLLVPSFQFNLISIYQLLVQLHCHALLTTSNIFIQGPSLKRPLAIGKADNGLYFLDLTSSSSL